MAQEQRSPIKQGSWIIAAVEYFTTDINIFSGSFFIKILFFFFSPLSTLLKILISFLHKEKLFFSITLLSLLLTFFILSIML